MAFCSQEDQVTTLCNAIWCETHSCPPSCWVWMIECCQADQKEGKSDAVIFDCFKRKKVNGGSLMLFTDLRTLFCCFVVLMLLMSYFVVLLFSCCCVFLSYFCCDTGFDTEVDYMVCFGSVSLYCFILLLPSLFSSAFCVFVGYVMFIVLIGRCLYLFSVGCCSQSS